MGFIYSSLRDCQECGSHKGNATYKTGFACQRLACIVHRASCGAAAIVC